MMLDRVKDPSLVENPTDSLYLNLLVEAIFLPPANVQENIVIENTATTKQTFQ